MPRSRKRLVVTTLIAIVAVLLTIGLVHNRTPEATPVALKGTKPLPKIAGKDLVTGTTIDLATYRGKPLLINAWAEWCIECREEAPVLKRFAAAHPEVTVVGIVGNSTRNRALKVNRELGWPWPSINDPNGMILLTTLDVSNYPSTLFVDSRGVLRGIKRGVVSDFELTDAAKRLT